MRLSELAVGGQARLVSIDGDRSSVMRMMEMGLIPGATIRVIGHAPGSLRIETNATRLALAQVLADRVRITAMPDHDRRTHGQRNPAS